MMTKRYKIYALLWLIVFIITNCNLPDNNANVEVIVKSNKDTVAINEEFYAEICVPLYFDSISPKFYLILEDDTANIYMDQKSRRGIYRATRDSIGIFKRYGFVEYPNKDGLYITNNFEIQFTVIDTTSKF